MRNQKQRDSKQKRPKRIFRQKKCRFCVDKIHVVDYKDVTSLRKSLTEKGKILPRRITGTCAKHQRQLSIAIKRARYMAFVAYIVD
ncbi:MAG: 30S ribosomal protein S18 [Candidatus Aureabacteria bacterium]|nr:30S ribosomal protein S18 [Candidatus Auribacterota bacterium]